jgi:tape measure domain-containing protein
MADNKLEIKITADNRQAVGALGESARAMGVVAQKVELAQVKLRSLAVAVAAGQAAFHALSRALAAIPRFAGESLRAAADFESISLSLKAVLGSAQAAEAEMQRLRETSNRLGIPLQTLAEQYLGFAAAAKGTALEGAQAREVFEAVAEAGTALGLRSAQIAGSLLALQQMMSKGAVSAEEMRQQLGERLYGALNIAARSIGLTTEQFSQLMERGLLPAGRLLPAFAEQLRRELGGGAADASNSARAAFARLENALLELKLEFARSGFMDAIVDAARQLTGAFQDAGFRQSVREFGALIGNLTRFVVEHGDKLVVLGGVLAGAQAGARIGRLAGPKGAVIGTGAGAVAGAIGAISILPESTASGADARAVKDVEAAIARLQRRIEDTRRASLLGTIAPEEARRLIAQDETTIARLRQTERPAAQAGGAAGAAFAAELNRKLLEDALKQYATTEEKLAEALAAMRERLRAAGVAEGSKEWQAALAKVRASFSRSARGAGETTAARLALLKAEAEAEFALLKDSLERQRRELDASLGERLVSIRDYYVKKTAIEQQEIDAERARREQELAAVRAVAADPKATESERLRALGELKKLEAEIEILNRRRADVVVDNARRQAAAERELANELARVRDRLAEIEGGAGGEVTRGRLEREYQPLIEQLQRIGDAAGVADVRRLIDVEANLAELAKLERQYQIVVERMAIRERELQVQRDAGMLTEMQMRREVLNLHQQTAAQVEGLIPKMQELAAATGSEEAINRVARLKVEVAGLKTEVDDVATRIQGDVQNAFVSMFEQIGSGAKKAKEAIRDFALSVVASLQRIAAQRLAEQIFGGTGKNSGIGGFIAGFFRALGFASGGPVPGTGNRDSVPALLTPGEYVIRRDVAQRLGRSFLDAINGGAWIPRIEMGRLAFASGGAVPAVGGLGGVTVHVHNHAPASVRTETREDRGERIIDIIIEQITGAQAREIARGAGLAAVLERRYGLSPAAGALR